MLETKSSRHAISPVLGSASSTAFQWQVMTVDRTAVGAAALIACVGAYDHWEVEVQRIARGELPGPGNITAVLFLCTPQSSNFYVQEVHV